MMGRRGIGRLARRQAAHLEAWLVLLIARLAIILFPYRWWHSRLAGIGADTPAVDDIDLDEVRRAIAIGRLVRRTARRVPFNALCLPQAIAARLMLRRRGIKTQIYYGARSGDERRPVRLHAWLMLGEHCLTGDDQRRAFQRFEPSPPARRANGAVNAADG